MLDEFRMVKWREAVPRILADLTVVHLSMLAALAVSAIYMLAVRRSAEAEVMVATVGQYYTRQFVLLSPLFIVAFFLSGFYTQTRSYSGKHKRMAILRGVGLAVMLFLTAHYALFGYLNFGRSVMFSFALLASAGLAGIRIIKEELVGLYGRRDQADISPASSGRVLVVGGAGYIGSLAVEQLLNRGYSVRVLDSLMYGDGPLRDMREHPRFELQVGDCRNIQDVVKAVRGVDAVLHLAAIVGDPACEQEPESALEINYAATRMLVEIAKGHGVGRFVFASSCSVYGASSVEVDEKSATKPVSLYGRTKVDSEQVVLRGNDDSFHSTVLRFATVFGLGRRPRFDLVVNLLTAKAITEGVITIFNGAQWRPMIHVRDIAEAVVRVMEAPVRLVAGEIFNVGDSRLNYTLGGIAESIREVFPNTSVEHRDNQDKRDYRVSFEKIKRILAFEAQYSLRDGIDELKHAFEEGIITNYQDLRYHNQRFLQASGSIGHKDELDGPLMAAFASHLERASRPASIA